MKNIFTVAFCCFMIGNVFATNVAVFPVQSTNADKSFADAFGMLLANKYAKIASCNTIAPNKSAKAIPADGNLAAAAQSLAADEYLEISAVGLYVSRREANQTYSDSGSSNKQIIIIKEKGDDGDDEDNDGTDQKLLDNSKTIVTVYRKSSSGADIYQTEMTLLTYGDIEESTERIAAALYKKISVEKTRGMTNVTRREGMGYNQVWARRSKGFKMGVLKPLCVDTTFSTIISVGFDYKVDLNRSYLEFGVGGRIPTGLDQDSIGTYGGNYFELGGGYYVVDNTFGVFAGAGLVPFFNWMDLNGSFLALPIYIQVGISTPRNSQVRFYGDIRIAQNVIGIKSSSILGTNSQHRNYPTEIGFEMGMAW